MTSPIANVSTQEFQPTASNATTAVGTTTFVRKPPISRVLGAILETPNAGKLLLGLNKLMGGVHNQALTGSVALALHQAKLGAEYVRMPNNLDVVVNQEAMSRLSQVEPENAAQFGFQFCHGSRNHLLWSDGARKLAVDLHEAQVSAAGRGLESAGDHDGARVVPLDILITNLERQAKDEPLNNKVKGDLAAIYSSLREQDESNWG